MNLKVEIRKCGLKYGIWKCIEKRRILGKSKKDRYFRELYERKDKNNDEK